ncbi:hypothetical protein PSEUDO8AS_30084 [Pseudomonas sp. 8AS]|nr:hypothetical protein PSEUDO8AS_30084 [Pseudomonas sp. 8AS]
MARLLLLAAFDVADNSTGDGANRRSGPSIAAGNCGNAGAGRSTDGRAAKGSLLLRSHRGAADHPRYGEDCGKR